MSSVDPESSSRVGMLNCRDPALQLSIINFRDISSHESDECPTLFHLNPCSLIFINSVNVVDSIE